MSGIYIFILTIERFMAVQFSAELKRFASNGDKTGWTYIIVPQKIAAVIKPGYRRSIRIKGRIDNHPVQGISMMPMGEGNFLIAINASIRKAIQKQKGRVEVVLEEDTTEYKINSELLTCLEDEPDALTWFNSLLPSHQRYYSKWIESGKTEPTRTKRIAMTVNAMLKRIEFGEMLRISKASKDLRGSSKSP